MRSKAVLCLLCLLAVGAVTRESRADEKRAKPDFALRDTEGVVRRLSDYRGKWVVLEWINFDCVPVNQLYAAPAAKMQALQRVFKAKGVIWLSLNSAGVGKRGYLSPQQSKSMLARLGASPTALLLDSAGTVGKAFRVQVTPEVRVISPRGDVVYRGGVESAGPGVPVRHLETVLNAGTSGRALPFAVKPARGCRIDYPASTAAASGPRAPDFTLTDSTGVARRLSAYRGKWVILEWVNYDCPFVQKQYHFSHKTMQALQARSAQHGIVWLSICSSAPGKEGYFSSAQANARMRRMGASPAAYLHDPRGAVGRSYRAQKTPDIRIISPEGTIAYAGGIDSIPSMSVRDIPRAKNYVALAIADIVGHRPIAIKKSRPYGCSVKY